MASASGRDASHAGRAAVTETIAETQRLIHEARKKVFRAETLIGELRDLVAKRNDRFAPCESKWLMDRRRPF